MVYHIKLFLHVKGTFVVDPIPFADMILKHHKIIQG